MANLIKRILLTSGHAVQVFPDPTGCPVYRDHGTECTRKTPCADVIISDQKMPNISGLDFFKLQRTRGCKAQDKNKALITAAEIPARLKKDMDAFGFHYIKKPFRIHDILRWIDECAERSQAAGPP